ncbi:MAG: phosphomannomutase, partial [Nitrospira sp.]
IYASCRLIEILTKANRPLSSLVEDLLPTSVTPEIRVDCEDDVKFELVKRVQARFLHYAKAKEPLGKEGIKIRDLITIDGIRIIFEDGWGLIRASNTQPALVLRFEATTPAKLHSIRGIVESELDSARRGLLS